MTFNPLSVVVVDDEQDIRNELIKAINETPELNVVASADNAEQAYELIKTEKPDAVFLDISLKGGDAFDVLNRLKKNKINIPAVILNTGFDEFEYAQRAHNQFNGEIILILKKPFFDGWTDTVIDIVDKTLAYKQKNRLPSLSDNLVMIKHDSITNLIKHSELILIQTDVQEKGKGKIVLSTKNGTYKTHKTIREFASELPNFFMRASRFAIVNINYIVSIDHSDQVVYLEGIKKSVGIGDAYKSDIMKMLK